MNHFEAVQGGTETNDSKVSSTNSHSMAILSIPNVFEKKHEVRILAHVYTNTQTFTMFHNEDTNYWGK